PDADRLAALATMAPALLGFAPSAPRTPPRIDDLRVPASRVSPPPSLAPFCSTDTVARVHHTFGRAYPDLVRAFAGDFAPAPDVVATPPDERAIDAVLDWCAHARLACVPFGGGTSVVGGVECPTPAGLSGVVSLDLRALDRVLDVERTSRSARIQAGASGPRLEEQLAAHGLSLRFYPQSFEHSTLGGWIATRAGGHYATVWTHIDDLVQSIRMTTPVGVWESRRLPASGAGPSPDRLALGSEGTLGVITESWVRVVPRPRFRASANFGFDGFVAGADALRALSQSGLFPSNARLIDGREALLNGVATNGKKALLLLAFESADHPLDAWIARAAELLRDAGGTLDPTGIVTRVTAEPRSTELPAASAAEGWKRAFFEAPYLQSALVTVGVMADTFETACTWDRFETLYSRVRTEVRDTLRRLCGGGIVTCRITHVYPDGPAPYFTFLAPVTPGNELAIWREVKHAACEALHASGGTITHHHAVGRTHRPWYDRERPEPFAAALRAAKAAVDPAGVLNPGVLIDPSEPTSR
ncbi:MAG: FAD-binding oxidoreductase, partial [Deltaproteobacteria bacterium]|nr:FAD-binding oxidoreductase [Deltaproteobacteria bacterium]